MSDLIPVHDIRAEESVIGSLLLMDAVPPHIPQMLSAEDFYSQRNRKIYEVMLEVEVPNLILVAHALSLKDELEAVGGAEYLALLVSTTPTSVHLKYYAKIVADCAAKRRIAKLLQGALDEPDSTRSPSQIATDLAASILATAPPETESFLSAKEIVDQALDDALNDEKPRIPLGFKYLDYWLGGGIAEGQVMTLGGRPGVGKSTLAAQVAVDAAFAGLPVALFSLEMTAKELMQRTVSSWTNVVSTNLDLVIRNDSKEAGRVMDAYGRYGDLPIHVLESAFHDTESISNWTRRMVSERGVKLVVVDHIQLTRGDEKRNRVDQLDDMTIALKGLAKELGIAVIAVSQLNRATAGAAKKPTMSNLRDSGAIEQNSDIVLLLHEVEVKDKMQLEEGEKKVAAIVAKNRSGGVGEQSLRFDARFSRFMAWQKRGV